MRFFRWLWPKETAPSEAFELGRDVASKIFADASTFVDQICEPRREKFLMVLDQRLTGIRPADGVTFAEQAQIELRIMWDNWRECEHELGVEAWELTQTKWSEVFSQLGGEEPIREIISSRVSWHSATLFSDGMGNAVEAIDRTKSES